MTTLEDLHKLNESFCTREEWHKVGLFWMDFDDSGVVRERGEDTYGKGDLISNTMMKIIFHNDTSSWAYLALESCKELLLIERRWPVSMDQSSDSKSRIDNWWRKILWRVGVRQFKPHRWPNGMTRDPYIFFYAACILLGKEEYIQEVKPPWYIWNLGFFAWRKCLYRRNWYNTLWYNEKKSHKLFYVTRLREFKAWAFIQT